MSNTINGFDRIAIALHHGNVGIKTGSSSRPGGKAHLLDSETGTTACGRKATTGMATTLIHDNVTADNIHSRYPLCKVCTKHLH